MRIIFAGTEEFSMPSLEFIDKHYQTVGLITQPDKPAGRGLKLNPPLVKEFCEKKNIPVFQPADLKETNFLDQLKQLKSDFLIEVAFGRIFPPEVLKIPVHCCINIHPSFLPGYRGAAPIRWVIINNEKQTGVTAHIMSEKIDEGKILYQEKFDIDPQDTFGALSEKLSQRCISVLGHALENYKENKFVLDPVDIYSVKDFYARKIKHDDFRIDWNKKAVEIFSLIRASHPKPGAFTFYRDKLIKIFESEIISEDQSGNRPGEILKADIKDGILVNTEKGILKIKRLQKENKNILYYKDFLNGFTLEEKEKFT
ncbi:MAG: methionyl-tRNA formyltransferase [Spirochaetes bacterium]|nr:methionyl-tRNA formyltransferase [Spirochaetota bacterium]